MATVVIPDRASTAVTVSGAVTVTSGTVTANAGTNLNTSLLALDASVLATNVLSGAVTETAPASDTASSGLNGRLQRIAQRLTSLIALLPTALISNRLDVNLGAAPATVTVTGTVTDGGTSKTLKTAVVSLAASGNVIANVSGKIIKVYSYAVQSVNDTMTVQLADDNGGNLVTPLWTFNAREGTVETVNPPSFIFKNSAQNKPIYANITGTGTIKICARYYDDDSS